MHARPTARLSPLHDHTPSSMLTIPLRDMRDAPVSSRHPTVYVSPHATVATGGGAARLHLRPSHPHACVYGCSAHCARPTMCLLGACWRPSTLLRQARAAAAALCRRALGRGARSRLNLPCARQSRAWPHRAATARAPSPSRRRHGTCGWLCWRPCPARPAPSRRCWRPSCSPVDARVWTRECGREGVDARVWTEHVHQRATSSGPRGGGDGDTLAHLLLQLARRGLHVRNGPVHLGLCSCGGTARSSCAQRRVRATARSLCTQRRAFAGGVRVRWQGGSSRG
jgi:hypothetical protein